MRLWLGYALSLIAVVGCSTEKEAVMKESTNSEARAQVSGVDRQYEDGAVRPQDDLYRYLNGKWLDTYQLPADKGAYGAFTAIDDQTQEQLRSIVDGLAERGQQDATAQKLADLYASFMDTGRLESLSFGPLKHEFAAIDAMRTKRDLPRMIARFNQVGAGAPYDVDIDPDAKDSTKYAVSLRQSGLGLPDRDYYLKDDAKLKDARAKYALHVEKMLGMIGDTAARNSAADILQLETKMADIQWTRVENRDPVKSYNKVAIGDLGALMPEYDWHAYLETAEVAGKVDYVIIRQVSYFKALNKLIAETPLAVWKNYFKWHQLSAAAPYLSMSFVEERFAFTGTTLRGVPENRPRWKRGMALLDGAMGEGIGRLYVEKYFPPQNKQRMQKLVQNLIDAYRRDIETLDWMSPATKVGAQEKLSKLQTKIGYPDQWRDYSGLTIDRDDLWGNVIRCDLFEYQRNIAKLGRPIDRSEWFMTPQTVNAYYNPVMNEIVFPAAILHPPFFNADADDAVNFGAIVAVIGHEVSHGFDDKGSQYDADGNLRDWFAPADHEKFAAKTRALVAQYDAYEPVSGYHLNGELTLGENIGDNSGLAIAYKAYQLALGSTVAPVIDGLTGPQRFYLGWAQVWRGKVRDEEAVQRVKTDPHAPPAVRGSAPLRNQPAFYEAFGVVSGDTMYLPPVQRVTIW